MSKQKRLETRYAWIEASLRYAGRFDKVSYGAFFDINPPQISADQSSFVEVMNESLVARGAARCLEIIKGKIAIVSPLPDHPVFDVLGARAWLQTLSTIPYVKTSEYRSVEPEPGILQSVCDAILRKKPVKIAELTISNATSWRNISPHSIIDCSGRLHVRSYDHHLDIFRNIPLSRIKDISKNDRGISYVGMDLDEDWHQQEEYTLRANPKACMNRTLAAAADFGLGRTDFMRKIQVPKALAGYLVDEISCAISETDGQAAPLLLKQG